MSTATLDSTMRSTVKPKSRDNDAVRKDRRVPAGHDVAAELTRLLADTYVLYNSTHMAHWNVEGRNFVSLHALFEEQYRNLADALDVMAERIRALGFFASGTLPQVLQHTDLPPAPITGSAEQLLETLIEQHGAVKRRIEGIIPLATAAQDESSVDFLVNRLRWHEKTIWMLRSCGSGPSATLEIERDARKGR